jgi:hypothetical protein
MSERNYLAHADFEHLDIERLRTRGLSAELLASRNHFEVSS